MTKVLELIAQLGRCKNSCWHASKGKRARSRENLGFAMLRTRWTVKGTEQLTVNSQQQLKAIATIVRTSQGRSSLKAKDTHTRDTHRHTHRVSHIHRSRHSRLKDEPHIIVELVCCRAAAVTNIYSYSRVELPLWHCPAQWDSGSDCSSSATKMHFMANCCCCCG